MIDIYKKLKICKIMQTSQNSNKKWILLLTLIYIIVSIILFALIYYRKLNSLKDILIDNIN